MVVLLQEAPVLGAWGLGWEVWCDGQEITQFTYFQQAGGQPLSHPAIEITYGLERILMALQVQLAGHMLWEHIAHGHLHSFNPVSDDRAVFASLL